MIQNLEKFQTGIEPAWPLRRPDDHSHFHVFIRSSKYVISYTAIRVSELRDVIRGN